MYSFQHLDISFLFYSTDFVQCVLKYTEKFKILISFRFCCCEYFKKLCFQPVLVAPPMSAFVSGPSDGSMGHTRWHSGCCTLVGLCTV